MNRIQPLPGFFNTGLVIKVVHGKLLCNAPGFTGMDAFFANSTQQNDIALAQFLLTHYDPEAAHNPTTVAEFQSDCITDLMSEGGTLPHESVKDWLFYRGYKGEAVAC